MKTTSAATTEGDRLAALKVSRCESARASLLAGDLEQARGLLHEAELVERLARLSSHRSRAPILAITLIGACGLLVFASWKLKLSTFANLEVSIRAETTAAQLTLVRPAALEPFRGVAVDVGHLGALAAQISDMPERRIADRWVRVQGAEVEVRHLRAAGGSRLAFSLSASTGKEPTLTLRAYAKEVDGELLVPPGAIVAAGDADGPVAPGARLSGDVPDVVSFGCADCADTPFRLDLRGVEPFAFGSVPVDRLGFAVEQAQPDGTTYFTSGLRAGSIRLLDADRTESIQGGDSLRLDVAQARRFQIGRSAREDTLSFVYEGTVRGLSLGPLGAERDLSPSILEFLFRQKALALLWGGAVFLWGLFTGVRTLWRGSSP